MNIVESVFQYANFAEDPERGVHLNLGARAEDYPVETTLIAYLLIELGISHADIPESTLQWLQKARKLDDPSILRPAYLMHPDSNTLKPKDKPNLLYALDDLFDNTSK